MNWRRRSTSGNRVYQAIPKVCNQGRSDLKRRTALKATKTVIPATAQGTNETATYLRGEVPQHYEMFATPQTLTGARTFTKCQTLWGSAFSRKGQSMPASGDRCRAVWLQSRRFEGLILAA